ncbi:MAG: hypothetical protein JJE04_06935 [Acidobacteriia bacterium]|nr:hypothetical protein [Terriglobia bacterium]
MRLLEKSLRNWLDALEVRCAAFDFKGDSKAKGFEGANDELKGKIALVKQDVYQDLYCAPAGTAGRDLLVSSLHRSGPAGLLAALKPDFWIVKTEADPECNIWRQKASDCRQQPEEFYLGLQTKIYRNGEYGHKEPQGNHAVSCREIDWSRYDIVICYDAAVPARVTKLHPKVTWCYYVSEPCMRSYKESELAPLTGYSFFLSQRYRRFRMFPRPANHVVEFPYFVQYYGCFHELLGVDPLRAHRDGVFIEGRSKSDLSDDAVASLERFGKVRWPSGCLENVLQGLLASKYFLLKEGRKWGNANIEAVACGCLALGSPTGQHHVSLFTPATCCSSFADSLARIEFFENNPDAYHAAVGRQRALLNRFCFERPLRDLIKKWRSV